MGPPRVKMHVIEGSHGVLSEDSGLMEYGTVLLGHDSEDLNSWLKFINFYSKRVSNQHLECDLIAKFKSGPYKSRIISSTKSLQYLNMQIVMSVPDCIFTDFFSVQITICFWSS